MRMLCLLLGALLGLTSARGQDSLSVAPQPSVAAASVLSGTRLAPQAWSRPYYYGLHQGLNVQLSASVMAAFGHHAPSGAGFAQHLQATYLAPLTPHLTLMAGAYVNNLTWSGLDARHAGIYGELSYQFDDHWEAHVYGQKNLAGHTTGFLPGLYGPCASPALYHSLGGYGSPIDGGYLGGADRLGAGVRYTPNQSLSIEVNVEQVWLPNQPYLPAPTNIHDQTRAFSSQHGMPTQRP